MKHMHEMTLFSKAFSNATYMFKSSSANHKVHHSTKSQHCEKEKKNRVHATIFNRLNAFA